MMFMHGLSWLSRHELQGTGQGHALDGMLVHTTSLLCKARAGVVRQIACLVGMSLALLCKSTGMLIDVLVWVAERAGGLGYMHARTEDGMQMGTHVSALALKSKSF